MSPPQHHSEPSARTPELTLFMLVTNRDCVLANYSILSYRKLWKIYDSFVLEVYANCLKEEKKARYFPQWQKLPYVSIRDNEANGKLVRRKGESFVSPEGRTFRYEESCEYYDEVWTREHQLTKTPFWATVDADFELLAPQFIVEMMNALRADPTLAGISTDHGSTAEVFDTYSKELIRLNERWHTWCCIYRRETGRYLREVSSFYWETILPEGLRHAFDSYAKFQQHLIGTGYRMAALPDRFQPQFIHYGAFSKNKSVTEKNVYLYRHLAIAAKRGAPLPLFGKLNWLIRHTAFRIFDRLFSGAVAERKVWDWDSD